VTLRQTQGHGESNRTMKYFSKINKLRKDSKAGFLMVEVLIVTSIIAVSVLAFMAVAQKSIYLSRQSLHTAQAVFLLEEGAEATRIVRDNGWVNITALNTSTDYYPTFSSTWTLSSTPNTVGIFTRTVNVEAVNRDNSTDDIAEVGTEDDGTRLVTVEVSWLEGGTTVTKTMSFYISDIFSS
jgi:Tfp pilus assembly protein PilV